MKVVYVLCHEQMLTFNLCVYILYIHTIYVYIFNFFPSLYAHILHAEH